MIYPGPGAAHATVALAIWAMGTRFELLLAGDNERDLRAAGEAAIADIEDAHARLNRFCSDSVIASLNTAPRGVPIRVDSEIASLLTLAERVRVQSGGAFDIAYGSACDGPAFRFDPAAASLTRLHDDAQLDLGAVGKGFALDIAAGSLREAGVVSAFLQGGTSTTIAIGRRPDHQRWSIEIPAPDGAERLRLSIEDLSVSISSQQDRAHVIDPRTGTAAERTRIAAVIGRSASETDAWSTALTLNARPKTDFGSILWTDGAWSLQLDAVNALVSTSPLTTEQG